MDRRDFSLPYRDFSKALLIRSDLVKHAYRFMSTIWPDVWEHAPDVARALSEIVYEEYTNFTMEPLHGGKMTLYVFLKDGRRVRLGDLGDGVQTLTVAMLLRKLVGPELVLWDDVEAHMNPRALLHLAGWLAEVLCDGVQVVVSTHSLEAVKVIVDVAKDLSRADARICLLSLRDGVLKARLMTLEEVERYERAGIDARMGEGFLL